MKKGSQKNGRALISAQGAEISVLSLGYTTERSSANLHIKRIAVFATQTIKNVPYLLHSHILVIR